MQNDIFYKILESAEDYYQAGQIQKAGEILKILLDGGTDISDDETQCYIRVLFAEIVMENSEYNCTEVKEILLQAKKYCELIDNFEIKEEFRVCIWLDFSKMYLDKGFYKQSEEYVFLALNESLDSRNPYVPGAVHNFVILLQNQNLIAKKRRETDKYASAIKNILIYQNVDLQDVDMVILFLKMAEIAFGKGDYEYGNIVFRRAYEIEKSYNRRCNLIYMYFLKNGYMIYNYVDKNMLKEIILYISKSVLEYIDDIVTIDTENEVYKLSKGISQILRMFIAYVYLGVIECDDKDFFEVVSNLKNIYAYILKIRNGINREKKIDNHWLTYDELIARIPDNTVFVDYTQFPSVLRRETILGDLAFSCFSVSKYNNCVQLYRYKSIYLLQERTLYLFLEATTRSDREKIVSLINEDYKINIKLYDLLLKKILTNINKKICRLYLCPDVELGCIPFSILMDENRNFLISKYDVAFIDSFRNFEGEYSYLNLKKESALVIADPRYTIDLSCKVENPYKYLQPLPFSKVEAEIVSEQLKTTPFIKEKATKYTLDGSDSQIVHIATHGELLEIQENEEETVFPLSRCSMYFAGANDFFCRGKELAGVGNGILTAEELLKYTIVGIKMCVLSICFSGNGQVDYSQGILGFRTAFLSKGVRVLVSALWEVDDFASAVFFSSFYKNVFNMGPVEALRKSQLYLKDVTLFELKQEGWFEKKKIHKLGLVASHMEEIASKPDETKLFNKTKYWAGFIVTIQ
jgi:CHAT domain-containing protein